MIGRSWDPSEANASLTPSEAERKSCDPKVCAAPAPPVPPISYIELLTLKD